MKEKPSLAYLIWGLVVLLIILHQDNWLWNDTTLVFGFMPIGLVYHARISIGASITWYLATRLAWPDELDEHSAPADQKGANS